MLGEIIQDSLPPLPLVLPIVLRLRLKRLPHKECLCAATYVRLLGVIWRGTNPQRAPAFVAMGRRRSKLRTRTYTEGG